MEKDREHDRKYNRGYDRENNRENGGKKDREYDVIIAGAGIAGLTSAAYLCRTGLKMLLCEKGEKTGGLVGSFEFKGFTFDSGIRAIENSGIVFPMLKQLGIDMEFTKNQITIGIGDERVKLVSKESLEDYQRMLERIFPDNIQDIGRITAEIRKVMGYMDVLYNPLFMDYMGDREYLVKTLLPWLARYEINIHKAMKLQEPINEYLGNFTDNRNLIDMITQHFFKNTPAFFALGYFSLYLDYNYPKGGTGVIVQKLEEFIESHGGTIMKNTEICSIDAGNRRVRTSAGEEYCYKKLVWAADMKRLYKEVDMEKAGVKPAGMKWKRQQEMVMENHGGDSILTVYLAADRDRSWFADRCGAHMFYTPSAEGLSSFWNGEAEYPESGEALKEWLKKYYELTTYEISCPSVRDRGLTPEGRTGIIISALMDYALVRKIKDMGWYEEFKVFSEDCIIDVMDRSVFPGIRKVISERFSSTPLTIERITGNSEGAITGWAFAGTVPAENRFKKIKRSIQTPIPNILQAGQWTFSPSGFPVSILTGKLAADEIIKEIGTMPERSGDGRKTE